MLTAGDTGTFTGATGTTYPAVVIDVPDGGLVGILYEVPPGHPVKSEGGEVIAHVPAAMFTPAG